MAMLAKAHHLEQVRMVKAVVPAAGYEWQREELVLRADGRTLHRRVRKRAKLGTGRAVEIEGWRIYGGSLPADPERFRTHLGTLGFTEV